MEKISVDQRQVREEPGARIPASSESAAPKFGGVTGDSMARKFQIKPQRVKLYQAKADNRRRFWH